MPTPAKGNASPTAYLNQIQDPNIRNAVRDILNQLGAIQKQLAVLGQLTRPLTQTINASNYQIKRIGDPSDPQDAVTLRYLQNYVANFAAQFQGSQAQAGGADGQPDTPTPPPTDIADHSGVVTDIWNMAPLGPTSTDVELYRFVQAVANALVGADPPLVCGLLHKGSGANIYTCAGETYSISRVCYDRGDVFKVLIDADPGGSRLPTWAFNAPLLPGEYRDVGASGSC